MELPAWHPASGEDLMDMRRESVLIEIPEEAYKQNSVYRPWGEIGQAPSPGSFHNRVDASVAPVGIAPPKHRLPLRGKRMRSTDQQRETTR
jgi:hypothetical protein